MTGLVSSIWRPVANKIDSMRQVRCRGAAATYANVSLPSRTSISAPSPSDLVSAYLGRKPSRLKALLPCGVAVRAVRWGTCRVSWSPACSVSSTPLREPLRVPRTGVPHDFPRGELLPGAGSDLLQRGRCEPGRLSCALPRGGRIPLDVEDVQPDLYRPRVTMSAITSSSSSSSSGKHLAGVDIVLPQLSRYETFPVIPRHREHDDHTLRGCPRPAQADTKVRAGSGPAPQALTCQERCRVDRLVRGVDLLEEAIVDGLPER